MKKRAIVIGLDGFDPTIAEQMCEQGRLPALRRLQKEGTFCRLKTTCPAQTPVAWSSFATGTNPGGHGIFDFVTRDPRTYLPEFALTRFEPPRTIFSRPQVKNQRKGTPLWQRLEQASIPAAVLRCPCTFPPDRGDTRMLAGMGVPDVRGSQGRGTFYTQDHSGTVPRAEPVFYLDGGERLTARVPGPRNPRSKPPSESACEIRIDIDRAARSLRIRPGGGSPVIEVREGAWSAWVRLQFSLSPLTTISGIARFYVPRLAPHLELYCSPVNFDPIAPMFEIAAPAGYARELSEALGPFSTLGMAEDHTGLENGYLDETAFVEQCDLVFEERRRMTLFELERMDEGLLFALFDTPDRMQHMLWRFGDPRHPAYDGERAEEWRARLREHYVLCDSMLSDVLQRAGREILFIVLSDHGFSDFRRAIHVNTWLWQEGLLALKNGKRPDADLGEGFAAVDWDRSYAYALGLAGIYLNMKGRESQGILEEGGEAERVRRAVQEGLAGLIDPATQCPAIHNVRRREELYCGPFLGRSPDLVVNCAPGFRVSWQTAMGGVPDGLFEDNARRWSGDHVVDPDCVPGVLFMNQPANRPQADILDLAPTVLAYFGVNKSQEMEGNSLI